MNAGPSPRVRGTLQRLCLEPSRRQVHPRVCGEHLEGHRDISPLRGPSPRVRGTRHLNWCRAGSGPGPSPRVRGTLVGARNFSGTESGPSPRVRGTLTTERLMGIAPPVHPRVCGEHGMIAHRGMPAHRSIPACAGNTAAAWVMRWLVSGPSPRVRGTPSVTARHRSL